MTTTATPYFALAQTPLAPALLQDGTFWAHAATFGSYVYDGEPIEITPDKVDNFIRVFTTGYPRKVPLDYEHDTVFLRDPERKAPGPIMKAGDIVEMKRVSAADDLAPSMRSQIEKANRALNNPDNFGLWIRIRPTSKALALVQQREMTELSIVWVENYKHNQTGEGQGPTILSVALTNTPFLDGMASIALTRSVSASGSPADPGTSQEKTRMTKLTALWSSLLGRPVTTEDEIAEGTKEVLKEKEAKITALGGEVAAQAGRFLALTSVLGESDPEKAVERVKALKARVDEAEAKERVAQEKALTAQVDGILQKYESRTTPATKAYFARMLKVDLASGGKAGDTETEKVLSAIPEHGITKRASGADTGKGIPTDRDSMIDERAKELLESDPQVKALASNPSAAWRLALQKAGAEFPKKKEAE